MEIGELNESEGAAAVALWRAAGLVRPWNDPDADLRRALDGPSSTVLAGRLDGPSPTEPGRPAEAKGDRLVATAVVGHDGHRGWVYYLAVAPSVRGRGYGRAMMAACERWLYDRGVPKLNLMVRADNERVLGFYDALGYGRDDVIVRSRRLDGADPSVS